MAFSDWQSRKSDGKPQGGNRWLLEGPAVSPLWPPAFAATKGVFTLGLGFPACPQYQVSVNLIKYLIGLLPGTKFLLQASKIPVLFSDAAEGPGNSVL